MPRRSKPPTVSIDAVAAEAGVSTMTVSRVMRETGNVAPKTVANVLAVVDRLGYVHNKLAGALATQRSSQVAVVIPSLRNIVFTEVLAGIASGLSGTGFQPVIGISEYDLEHERNLVRSMLSWRPAGVILANIGHHEETRRMLQQNDLPVVELMELTDDPIDMCVGLDHEAAGARSAEYVVGLGYRHFSYLGADHDFDRAAGRRFRGFSAVVENAGGSIGHVLTLNEPSGIGLGRAGMSELLRDAGETEAVYVSNDAVAAGAFLHCLTHRIRIPEDIGLVSFSGLELASAMPLQITTIKSPRFEMGMLGARKILARLDGNSPPRITDVGFELDRGGTVRTMLE